MGDDMIPIYLCEDNTLQLDLLKSMIEKYIFIQAYDMEIRQAVHTPHELLDLLPDQPENAVYFLDIHLHSDMDGIELASAIRQKDPRAFIIFYYDAFRNGNDNVPLSGRTAGFFNQRRSELHPADSSLFAERSREK